MDPSYSIVIIAALVSLGGAFISIFGKHLLSNRRYYAHKKETAELKLKLGGERFRLSLLNHGLKSITISNITIVTPNTREVDYLNSVVTDADTLDFVHGKVCLPNTREDMFGAMSVLLDYWGKNKNWRWRIQGPELTITSELDEEFAAELEWDVMEPLYKTYRHISKKNNTILKPYQSWENSFYQRVLFWVFSAELLSIFVVHNWDAIYYTLSSWVQTLVHLLYV